MYLLSLYYKYFLSLFTVFFHVTLWAFEVLKIVLQNINPQLSLSETELIQLILSCNADSALCLGRVP